MTLGGDHLMPLKISTLVESAATQWSDEKHETETRASPESISFGELHVPPRRMRALPPESTAAQKVDEAHETDVIVTGSMYNGADHAPALAAFTPLTTTARRAC